jgi:integrase
MASTVAAKPRRGHGEDSFYYDTKNKVWTAAASLGYGPDGKRKRIKVYGRTKTEARDALKAKRAELEQGLRTSATYTLTQCVDEWLNHDLDNVAERTRKLYRGLLAPVTEMIGHKPLRELSALDIRSALESLADRYSTRAMQITRNCLERAIRRAETGDLVGRNVAALVKAPKGRPGRESKSMTLEQAKKLMDAAKGRRLEAYIVVSLLTGLRTEEARALRWDHVDLEAGTLSVWHSVRQGGDTKTPKSRRTLRLPQLAVDALKAHKASQAADRLEAGPLWQDHGLVFASTVGTPMGVMNVNRDFRKITKAAGLGENWVPREMRTTHVSLMSLGGMPNEEITRLTGHQRTSTLEAVYRKELRPVIATGAAIMDDMFA